QKNELAITGAFYFDHDRPQPPPPVAARVRARIADAETGTPLSGSLDEIAYSGTIAQAGKKHPFTAGQALITVPATLRLRASVAGYEQQTLSPFLDNPKLVDLITHLSDSDLLEWKTLDRIREELGRVGLEFNLKKLSR